MYYARPSYVYTTKERIPRPAKASVPSLRIHHCIYLFSDTDSTDTPAPPERGCRTAHYASIKVVASH